MQTAPLVVALILNWNLPEDTFKCVASLRKSLYPNLRILVIDNGSTPENYQRLRSLVREPDAEILRLDKNLGFAAGNNVGLRKALQMGAAYAFVLNNDTVVDPAMLGQLVDVAQTDPRIALAGPIIYYEDAPEKVWFAGYRFTHDIYVLRRGLRLKPPIRPVEDVDFVSGCGVLMRCAALAHHGLFAEDYFMYYEDVDLCMRYKKAEQRIVCVTAASMWHAVSLSSGGTDSPAKQYLQVRSSLIFYRRHFRGPKLWLNLALRFGHVFYTLAKAVLRGKVNLKALRPYLKGVREGWAQPNHTPNG